MSNSALSRPSLLPTMSRNTSIVLSVIALHVVVLWAMQSGLLRRVAQAVVPSEILVEIMSPTVVPPAPQPAPPQPKVQPKAVTPKPTPPAPAPTPVATQQPSPVPLAIAPSTPAPEPSAAAPTAVAAAPAPAKVSGPPPPPPPPKVELPSSDAYHLSNPVAPYPRASKLRNETGTVILRILIGTDGLPKDIRIEKSSGFERLDEAALATVRRWKFVPGKLDGKPVEMWGLQSIPFVLN